MCSDQQQVDNPNSFNIMVPLKHNIALTHTSQLQVIKKLTNQRVWHLFPLRVFNKETVATPFN